MEALPASAKPQVVYLKPVIFVEEGTPQYYINHLDITSNQHEFSFSFGRMSSRFSEDKVQTINGERVLNVPADVQILMPPTLIIGLLRALNIQKDFYEKQNNVTLSEPIGAQKNE